MEHVLSASEARQVFADIVDRANFAAERFVIAKNGRSVAVIVGFEEYVHLRKLENDSDMRVAKEVTTAPSTIKKFRSKSARTDSPKERRS